MTILQAIFLGMVQGLTEFLPISSSGHLVLFQKIFHLTQAPVLFDIIVHVGTLTAVLVYFKQAIVKTPLHYWFKIIIATIPVVIAGIAIRPYIESAFNSLLLVSLGWLGTGILLLSLKRIETDTSKSSSVTLSQATKIGLVQAISILPGVSRSGTTITAALYQKIPREVAFTFSFLLSLPAIFGALSLELFSLSTTPTISWPTLLSGFITAAITGYFSIKLLHVCLNHKRFYQFGFYCLAIGGITLLSTLTSG